MHQTKSSVNTENQQAAPAIVNQRPSFSVGSGIITTNLGSNELGNAVAIQADGKIVVAGVTGVGMYNNYFLTRYNPDGSLDLSFNKTGTLLTTTTAIPQDRTSVIIQADGKILFGGYNVLRVTTDGQLDSSFYGQSSAVNVIYHVNMQADGKIILAGFKSNEQVNAPEYDFNTVVERLNQDGSLDRSFNQNAYVEFNLGRTDSAESTVIQTDGKIIIASYVDGITTISRLRSDGSIDTSYGTNGKFIFNGASWGIADPQAMKLQTDGKLLLTGSSPNGAFVARFNDNGTPDTTFNGIGYREFTVATGYSRIEPLAMDIQSDGKIIVAGINGFTHDGVLIAARLNPNGSMDTTFNTTGILVIDEGLSGATGIDIQTDGKIVFSSTKNLDLAFVRVNSNGSLDKALDVQKSVDATVTFTGGGTAVVLDNNARIYDVDFEKSNNYANSTLTLERVGGAHIQDVFLGSGSLKLENGKVVVLNVEIGNYSLVNGQLQMTFNSNATQELVSASLQQIAYKNTNNHLTKTISMSWKFDDGSRAANSFTTATSTVNIQAAANPNSPTSADSTIIGREDEAYTFKLSDFVFKDVDAADSLQAIVITGIPALGQLYTKGINGTDIRPVDIADTIQVNDILAGKLFYQGAMNASGNQYSSFRVKVSDGADTSASATININLTPVNDAPIGTVSIAGKFTVGNTLSASNNVVDADGLGAITYQWKTNGIAIDGANSSSFLLSEKDVGKIISVTAQYIDAFGTREAVSSLASKSIGRNYIGTEKNDQFVSQIEDESFSGGVGNDTVIYRSNLSNYTIKNLGSHFEVVSKLGYDGTDSLMNIETIQFSDININLGIQSKAAASSVAEIQTLIELYIAFFNRVPDANGLSYWMGELQAGQKIAQIAESFFDAGTKYPLLTGYSATMTDGDFVNTIFKNTLGRAGGADAEGLNYWKGELASGRATHGSLVVAILDSAHSSKGNAQWGFVADLLDNKIAVGKKMAIDWGISFNSDAESVAKGMAIAALVTSTATEQALELIGIRNQDISLY
ncbi:DUF4214 domain-containing protein [Undibacterium seohonense]|uniref:DUF4214 domain-containing protein n=1 Tax=Undibacterium seohonense TaxID=1344950 RepID=A0ABR6X413_9BURK|nr:DUF4214 domain-containing protein [Undibacterium seohonense]MBC3807678.1 DUF4214 domain-containing protein [Undibacterium seohonense]